MNPIIIAVHTRDAREYAEARGWRNHIIVTPRTSWAARGRTGPVYATDAALDHPDYEQMLEETKLCGIAVDTDRVA